MSSSRLVRINKHRIAYLDVVMVLPTAIAGRYGQAKVGVAAASPPAPADFPPARRTIHPSIQLDTHLRIPSRLDHDIASAAIRDARPRLRLPPEPNELGS